jgi:hypothetical protein
MNYFSSILFWRVLEKGRTILYDVLKYELLVMLFWALYKFNYNFYIISIYTLKCVFIFCYITYADFMVKPSNTLQIEQNFGNVSFTKVSSKLITRNLYKYRCTDGLILISTHRLSI